MLKKPGTFADPWCKARNRIDSTRSNRTVTSRTVTLARAQGPNPNPKVERSYEDVSHSLREARIAPVLLLLRIMH